MWHNSINALAQIHAADWRALGLDFLDTDANGSGVHAQLANWRESFTWAADGEANPTIEHALEWLADNVPAAPSATVLNWGDARVGNIIFADDLSAAALLDWEMVTLGCRELDLGWWLFLMRHHTEGGIGFPLPEAFRIAPTLWRTTRRSPATPPRWTSTITRSSPPPNCPSSWCGPHT